MGATYSELQRQVVRQLECGRAGCTGAAARPPVDGFRDQAAGRCLTSVVFVPARTAKQIHATVSQPLRELEPWHCYHPPESMHITVKNVRCVHAPPRFDENDVLTCSRVFSAVVPRHRPFNFQLEEIVPFASSVSVIGYCDERLKDLVLDLDRALRDAGLPDDKSYISASVFFGNVTICRFTAPPREAFLRRVADLRHALTAVAPVEAVSAITCDSMCSSESLTIIRTDPLAGRSPTDRKQQDAAQSLSESGRESIESDTGMGSRQE